MELMKQGAMAAKNNYKVAQQKKLEQLHADSTMSGTVIQNSGLINGPNPNANAQSIASSQQQFYQNLKNPQTTGSSNPNEQTQATTDFGLTT